MLCPLATNGSVQNISKYLFFLNILLASKKKKQINFFSFNFCEFMQNIITFN